MGAVIAGLVPNGLILMIIVAYGMGAVRIAGRGALVQQANAVESLSNVTVLCLDKTGTLTSNRIIFESMSVLTGEEAWVRDQLASYAASASGGTRTSEAITAALGGSAKQVQAEIPFSSDRKWSALAFVDDPQHWVLALGAPETLAQQTALTAAQRTRIEELESSGRRVLLFAGSIGAGERLPAEWTSLPEGTKPLAIVTFTDELRDEAREALRQFAEAGVAIKIISGDSPETVLALVRQAGIEANDGAVSGLEVNGISDDELGKIVESHTVFGRITPQLKERLVGALVSRGHYVAMIGDGVNDVLSLKRAQVGIAMRSGAQATRAVADVVLLNDSFGSLAPAIQEGQRIRNGMESILRLFLTRVLAVALLITSVAMVNAGFPLSPKHNSVLTFLTVGVPTFALALWARPGVPRLDLVRSMLGFVLPSAFLIAVVDLLGYLYFLTQNLPPNYNSLPGFQMRAALSVAEVVARSGVTTISVLCGLLLVVFVSPPTELWAAGSPVSRDWRPTILAGALVVVYAAMTAVRPIASFFEIVVHRPVDYAVIVALVVLWAAMLLFTWRRNLVGRFLDADLP